MYHKPFYHIIDFEQIWQRLCTKFPAEISRFKDGFDIWTEFHATYSTFDILEDHQLYIDFKKVFEENKNIEKKTYYTSRILGYYLKDNHADECDMLIQKHLNNKWVLEISKQLNHMKIYYTEISINDLISLKDLIEKCISYREQFNEYKPISQADFFAHLKSMQKSK